MNELRLIFPNDQADRMVAVGFGPNVTSAIPFDCDLSKEDYENLRWYLEDFLDLPDGGSVVRAQSVETKLNEWGRQLHDAVFSAGANLALLKQLLDAPEPRVLTVGTGDAGLLRLPWELIADEAGPLANRVSLRRQLETPATLVERAAVLPLRLLYIVSRPGDTGFIDPRLTARSVLDALDPLGASVRIDFCRPPTLGRMEEMLSNADRDGDPYDLVHFDGHGTFEEDAQQGALCFEKPDEGLAEIKTDLVRADRLGEILAAHQIPLVILEACRSATVGQTAVFRSVAPRLIQAGVASVLSMGHAVHVEAARRLLDRFYRELVLGTTIGQALAHGRSALLAGSDRWIEYGPQGRTVKLQDWFLPHLYQRGSDDALLPAASAEAPRQFDVFLSHNHADSDRVERLARVLDEKHGLRVWLDKWECKPGQLKPQCELGIRNSRYTVVVASAAALQSKWVEWEIEKGFEVTPDGAKLLPLKFEELELPGELNSLLWVDFTDPAKDEPGTRQLAGLIRSSDAEDARHRRGYRAPATGKDEAGAFPPSPMYEFQGRARELHLLERRFRNNRAILLHAMGGMGKTALATEGAHWWTRSGLFRDGACFVSFEQFASAERVIQIFGAYMEGPNFESLPAREQRRRAIESFNEKDVLLVWDNFESVLPQFNEEADSSSAHAGPYTADERARLYDLCSELIASPKGNGRLLITCRPGDVGLPGVFRTELEGLSRPDSLWMLSRVIAKDGLTLNDPRLTKEKLDPLLDTLADHPLSIELVAPHLKKLTPEAIIADFAKLVAEFKRGAGVERNESLLASLTFSTRHLSPEAQAALPWLGLFSGGVFEQIFLDISGLDPEQWEVARSDLEATALIRVVHDFSLADRPYLRFHPTLAYSAAGQSVVNTEEVHKHFVETYSRLMLTVDQALEGPNPLEGMIALSREEANSRAAVRWALTNREYGAASSMGSTFAWYLENSGRLRERDTWVTWLAQEVRKGGFSRALAERERDEAWTLLIQGNPDEAIRRLENLIENLQAATDFDPGFQLTVTRHMLGRVLLNSDLIARAIPVLEAVVNQWELRVQKLDSGGASVRESGNLAVALADLAQALRLAGHHDWALNTAERGQAISRELGIDSDVANSLTLCARILVEQGRYSEADTRYKDALAAARRAGDRLLEAITIQHQGGLAKDLRQYDRAVRLYQQALKLFQEMNDSSGVMNTCSLLGSVESRQGRFQEARTWFKRSHEIAESLKDVGGQATAAQDIGIVCQSEAKEALRQGREQDARQSLEEARRSISAALELTRPLSNPPDVALSLGQLAQVCLMLGELDEAERNAREYLKITEELGIVRQLPDAYATLAAIARARKDATQAAEWERKREAAIGELKRRAAGEEEEKPQTFSEILEALAMASLRARLAQAPLETEAANALDQLSQAPPPVPALVSFLRGVAAGELPDVPAELPASVTEYLTVMLEGIKDSK